MKKHGHRLTAADDIAGDAADWVIRRDRGLTAEEQDEMSAWLALSPAHREAFAERAAEWEAMNILSEWRPEHSVTPNPDLLARPTSRRRRLLLPVMLSIAACLALAITFMHRRNASTTEIASFESQKQSPRPQTRTLEDGSVVELNAGADLDVAFSAAERRVRLVRGEARFKVAKNPARPFIVQAGKVEFRAVGTAFNVSMREREVEMFVTEGKVSVREDCAKAPDAKPPVLQAGQCAVVSVGDGDNRLKVTNLTPDDVSRRLAWAPRMLEFNSSRLEDVVVEFNRLNRVQVVILDPSLKALQIVASFRSDNVEGFVHMLEISEGVEVRRLGDVITLKRQGAARP